MLACLQPESLDEGRGEPKTIGLCELTEPIEDRLEQRRVRLDGVLAPHLLAAALDGARIADVVRWIDSQATDEVKQILKTANQHDALGAATAGWNREARTKSSIYTTAENVLAAYSDPKVLAAAQGAEISPERLLSGANTLYLRAPAHEQRRLAPVFAALLEEVISYAYELASADGGELKRPLLIVGDELANIAPIRSLPELASTGAGQGIQLVSIFQDVAQMQSVWGREGWRTIANNHRAKLFGSGQGDPETLRYVRDLAGEEEYGTRSHAVHHLGQHPTTESRQIRSLAPSHVVREQSDGEAVLVYGNLPPARIKLRLWFRDRALRTLVTALPPAGNKRLPKSPASAASCVVEDKEPSPAQPSLPEASCVGELAGSQDGSIAEWECVRWVADPMRDEHAKQMSPEEIAVMRDAGLDPSEANRYPDELDGFARAMLATNGVPPEFCERPLGEYSIEALIREWMRSR